MKELSDGLINEGKKKLLAFLENDIIQFDLRGDG